MGTTIPNPAARCQADPDSRFAGDEGNGLSLRLQLLRAAIDESGWKHAAVAATIGVEAQYLSRMLSGEKPLTLRHLEALPDEIEILFARLYAEALGLIAVQLPATREEAQRDLVSGLLGLFSQQFPSRASAMAKADLPQRAAKAAV